MSAHMCEFMCFVCVSVCVCVCVCVCVRAQLLSSKDLKLELEVFK